MHNQNDTIVALATPPGRSALAVIRISGPDALRLLTPHLSAGHRLAVTPRQAVLARFSDSAGHVIDQVLVTLFEEPRSYTGQTMVEISPHGSPPIVHEILRVLLESGMRLAEPGEFTLRAFLYGKMDLAQAEGVRDLINSQTAFQARVAREQVEGRLSRALQPIKREIVLVVTHMETTLEFAEDDVDTGSRSSLLEALAGVAGELDRLLGSFRLGALVHEGVQIAIVGKPNAGKSSLFNALLQDDRAIVTEIPGTTRDALTESIDLGGIPARLVDTAGIRASEDRLEILGIEKSLAYLRESHLVLFVLDGSSEFEAADYAVWESIQSLRYIAVINKEDQHRRLVLPERVRTGAHGEVDVSALTHHHLDELRRLMIETLVSGVALETEQAVVTSLRHQQCLVRTRDHIRLAIAAGESGLSEEFVLEDLRGALKALGQVTGETTVDDILDKIFSTFCIGK